MVYIIDETAPAYWTTIEVDVTMNCHQKIRLKKLITLWLNWILCNFNHNYCDWRICLPIHFTRVNTFQQALLVGFSLNEHSKGFPSPFACRCWTHPQYFKIEEDYVFSTDEESGQTVVGACTCLFLFAFKVQIWNSTSKDSSRHWIPERIIIKVTKSSTLILDSWFIC